MSLSLVDHFKYQTRVAVHVTNRDALKRLIAALMIMLICWQFGYRNVAIFWSAIIVTSEVIARMINRRISLTGPQLSFGACFALWTVNWLGIWPMLAPAIILAAHGSDALLVVGLLWLFGVHVHISNSYAALPFFYWSLIASLFAMTTLMFWQGFMAPTLQSTLLEWCAAVAMLVAYAVNALQTMSAQKDTLTKLAEARKDADKRLTELEFLTRHDHLTGLMNRRAFEEAATLLLPRRSNRDRSQLGYFLIDLDGFKPINDSYSHKAGDAVLVAVAERLSKFVGSSGVVARLGGDEFATAISGVQNSAQALRLATEIANVIKQPIIVDHKQLEVGASVGVALTSSSQDTLAGIASGADQAMYKAKNDPGQSAFVYDRNNFPIRASLDDRVTILRAMQKQNIAPYYQPKINLETGFIEGFEALSRWRHPTRGLLLPGKFLPYIDELGLQSEFLMRTTGLVLQQIEDWQKEGFDPGEVSVNLPEVTLATLSGRASVMELIEKFPQARSKLTFEVTEDVFIARSGNLIQESIAAFRKAGIRISLDDFGTGFASFKHLRELEFDELKLDTGFVRGLGHDKAAEVLVEGFLGIGKGLGVKVIAEGVETETQRTLLRKMGCTICQGFYYSPAMPHNEARDALWRQHHLGVPFTKTRATETTEAEDAA
ncbi:diguanylate cyclase (GGDEF)-like protein [Loktanella ponticola]|uniref:Diguanylate cyclase (GGDEF)-like protein n=1 Tax=Yoonia ponticola TaxID=1524255 RepID=A0A7W9BN55_9RHOB|nr:EAL domain-containing protein [Yoonia ponticola]MBB5723104.1 diguanylate cyclase (GGDEF)-like protein [Yoonia ponticola]